MKYIHNRNKFSELNRINEILDSDNIDVEFSDTLIGGTLHRLFGFVRSNISDANMKKYSKELDRLLASMVVEPTLDDINESRPDDEKVSMEELTEEGQELESSILYLKAAEKLTENDVEGAQKLLEGIPVEILKGLPEAEKISSLIKFEEEVENDETEFKEGDMAVYNNTQVQVVYINDEEGVVKVKNEEGQETEVDINQLQLSDTEVEDSNPDISKELELISKYEKEIQKISEFCIKCIKDDKTLNKFKKVAENANAIVNSLKIELERTKKVDGGVINQLDNAMGILRNICKECENPNNDSDRVQENVSLLLEKAEAVDVLTNKEFAKIKKELDKKAKELKITEEDLRKLNKELSETKGISEISGDNAKKLIDVLTKAKNSLLHTKPYEEIRKKQKRYFDKLDSGRAVSRKAYQKWVKNVTELVNYYKDKLPKNVITVISDSLDKEAISNDYVKINKEFLGVDKRENKGDLFKDSDSDEVKETEIKVGTEENKLRFVGVEELNLSKNICFVMEVVSNNGGKNGFITGLVFKSTNNSFQFKFILDLNTKWLEGYYDGKTIETNTNKPDTKIKTINDDLNGVKIGNTNKYGKVFYAEAVGKSVVVSKGNQLAINYLNFSDLIESSLTDIDNVQLIDEKTMNTIDYKSSKWQVNKLGVLVGSKDMKAATYKINSKKLDARDGYFDPKLYNQITEIFNDGTESISVDELKEGDKIKYRRNNGEINDGVVGAKEDLKDDTLRVTTENSPEGFIINKNQIIQ